MCACARACVVQGIFSGDASEDEDAGSDFEGRSDDEDEWVSCYVTSQNLRGHVTVSSRSRHSTPRSHDLLGHVPYLKGHVAG